MKISFLSSNVRVSPNMYRRRMFECQVKVASITILISFTSHSIRHKKNISATIWHSTYSCHNTIQSASLFVYEGVEPYKTEFNFLNQSVSFIFETSFYHPKEKLKPQIVRLKISIYVCDSCLADIARCNRAVYLSGEIKRRYTLYT